MAALVNIGVRLKTVYGFSSIALLQLIMLLWRELITAKIVNKMIQSGLIVIF
jgi:hypothetical protein